MIGELDDIKICGMASAVPTYEDDNSKYDEGTSTYLGQTTTNIYSFGNVKKEEKKFKIFIKSEQSSQEELDFDVELNSAQKDMQQ